MTGPGVPIPNSQTPDFGRVRRAMLRRGEGDRVPLFEMSIHGSHKAAILGRPLSSLQDEVGFWHTAGYDFVSTRAGVRSVVRGYHPAVREWRAAHGQAREVDGWVAEEAAFIRDRHDFEAFPWPSPEELGGYPGYDNLDEYIEVMAGLLPAGMKLLIQLGYVFMGAWQILGFENYCLKLADDPDLVRDVHDWLGASQLTVLEMLLQYDCVGTIWLPDDLCYNSGPMVAPRVYGRHVYPWYVRIVERCHRAGVPVGLHSDGDLTRLLPDLVDCGFDAIHPFEPPMNDIIDVKRRWGDRIAVAGGIALKETLCEGTPADVEAEVQARIAALAPGGGWLLGSSNSIPDFVPVENYRALLAASLQYGDYKRQRAQYPIPNLQCPVPSQPSRGRKEIMPLGKEIRLQRLKNPASGRILTVAVDHAPSYGVLPGLERIQQVVDRMAGAGPDALLLMKGTAARCFRPHAGRVALILKSSTLSPHHPQHDVWVSPVEDAVSLGADAIAMALTVGSPHQALLLSNVAALVREAERAGMPVVVHAYPNGEGVPPEEVYSSERVGYASRLAMDLGVDIVKTFYTGSAESFRRVVEMAAPALVVAAGGPRLETDADVLRMAHAVVQAGAAGLTFGRNIWQSDDPAALIRALKQILHQNGTVDEALAQLEKQ